MARRSTLALATASTASFRVEVLGQVLTRGAKVDLDAVLVKPGEGPHFEGRPLQLEGNLLVGD